MEYLNVNERWMRRAVAERRIRFTKAGHLLRFRKSWLDDYLRENEQSPIKVVRINSAEPASRTRRKARSGLTTRRWRDGAHDQANARAGCA